MFNIRNAFDRLSCEITRRRTRAIAVYYVPLPPSQPKKRAKMISFDPADKGR